MGALSPKSSGVEVGARPPRAAGSATAFLKVPLRFMVTGMLALVLAVTGFIARPEMLATYHYNQYVIAATHLFVLGWLLSVVVGAMYQLVPVALETRLYSEKLARLHFYLHLVGFAGMVWMFWRWDMTQVGHFASVLALGVVLFVYNLVRTILRVPKWSVVAAAVCCVLVWFGLTVLAGLTITAGKCSYDMAGAEARGFGWLVGPMRDLGRFAAGFDAISAMHAHAHLGVVGLFVMLLAGVSYRLVPMFTLSEIQSPARAGVSLGLLNLGLASSFLAILNRSAWKPAFSAVLVAGLAVYGWELLAILRARKRRVLDWGLKFFLTGLCLLVPVSLLALVLGWPGLPLTAFTGQLENAYGFLALAGVLSLAIMGMLYKIIPFLVWQSAYSSLVGLRKVPTLADLYSQRLQAWGYWAYLPGLLVTTAGIVLGQALTVRLGAMLLLLSVIFLCANVARMLSHLYRPATGATLGSPVVPRPQLAAAK